MIDAESKTKKRIRHCYPRHALYHQFVHSDIYAYSPANRHQISCIGNYLFIGDVGKNSTVESIENELWYHYQTRIIAIIDRDNKIILINRTYSYHLQDLKSAIPNNYIVCYTNNNIPNKSILYNKEECYKIHLKCLIEQFVERDLYNFYKVLYGDGQTLYNSLISDTIRSYGYYYDQIITFVKHNKIKKYKFYKECFNDKYNTGIWKGFNRITVKLPTLQQIVNDTFFTKKEKLFFEQKRFYSNYCYNEHIPFKDVVENWNKEVDRNKIIIYLNRIQIVNTEWYTTEKTWNEYIITTIENNRKIVKNNIARFIKESDENYSKALAKLLANRPTNVNNWREFKTISKNSVIYKSYIPNKNRNHIGKWIDKTIYDNSTTFPNTQLRLSKNGKRIETSRYCNVPLEDGIHMYKMFLKCRQNNPKQTNWTTSQFGNIKIGIYNLRYIAYLDKKTDNGNQLGYKEWVIQIGCHSLWLDDIQNFIKYYHLEKEFSINNVKIQIK